MLLISIAVCTLILSAQTQNQPYQNSFLLDQIFFGDNGPPFQQDNTRQQQALPVFPLNRNNAAVEIEKSNEVSATTTYDIEQQKTSGQVANFNGQVAQTAIGRIPQRGNVQIKQRIGQAPQAPNEQIAQASLGQPFAPNRVGYNRLLYSMTNFGLNLMRDINQGGNVVISPYSITSALALLQQGSMGKTQEQITAALQITPNDSATSFSEILADFERRSSRNILKTACNVFVDGSFTLNPGFKKIAEQSFYSDITPISFSRPEPAASQINSWIASRTDNKIQKLVSPDSLDETTQVVLVNAVYFKGIWEIPFRVESTKPREFHLSNRAKKIVPFMSTRRYMKAGFDPTSNAKIIILPFERAQYSLMVILPSPLLGVDGTLAQMTDARLLSYQSFTAAETELHIPKFTVRADTDLVQVLRKMGVTNMFGPSAELGGLGSYQDFSPQISSAVHSAVLSIDEQGGSAAAATSFAAVALSNDEPAVKFKADRPFIAVLWDETTSLPLFMAKIEDPSQ